MVDLLTNAGPLGAAVDVQNEVCVHVCLCVSI